MELAKLAEDVRELATGLRRAGSGGEAPPQAPQQGDAAAGGTSYAQRQAPALGPRPEAGLQGESPRSGGGPPAASGGRRHFPRLGSWGRGGSAGAGAGGGPWVRVAADEAKAAAVREAMRHSWAGYSRYAMGFDELQPMSQKGKNPFGGMGATVVDALDTLHLMGLSAEYAEARDWVAGKLHFDHAFDASVFETTIRIMGGLLAARDLTGDDMYVAKALELAVRLRPAFNTETGIPYAAVNLRSGRPKSSSAMRPSTLSEFGTLQLEFMALSDATGDSSWANLAEGVIRIMLDANNRLKGRAAGLFPLYLNPHSNTFTSQRVSFGAMGDSFYEYLLKVWVYGGRTPAMAPYRQLYDAAMESMAAVLVFRSTPSGMVYVAEMADHGSISHKMDHLACFVPAMLALGAHGASGGQHMALAGGLVDTCYQMYARQKSGLAPEICQFRDGHDMVVPERSAHNLQRPETIEALFLLYRRTGNKTYRAMGWEIFQNFERHTRVGAGYSGVRDVRVVPVVHDDTQQSFWLAETLKYFFLLFSDSDTLNLDEWVLNTEAHPLRIRPRNSSLLSMGGSSAPKTKL